MDRRCLRSANDIERNRLVGVAPETTNLKIAVAGVQRVAQHGGRLRRPLAAEHPHVPSFARQTIGLIARFLGALGGSPNGGAIDRLPRLGGHPLRCADGIDNGKSLPL